MARTTRRSTRKTAPKSTFTKEAVEAIKEAPKTAEARVKALIESGKPALERAQAFASETQKNLSKQSKAIRKDIAHRVADIGTRVDKERKSLGRRVEGAVKTTLASLNIPTRSEINLLAKRVEELSRKIDSLKRR
jgi:polyhydroxyalkanoate synthesis regulator phasin